MVEDSGNDVQAEGETAVPAAEASPIKSISTDDISRDEYLDTLLRLYGRRWFQFSLGGVMRLTAVLAVLFTALRWGSGAGLFATLLVGSFVASGAGMVLLVLGTAQVRRGRRRDGREAIIVGLCMLPLFPLVLGTAILLDDWISGL
jgi:hypothetical protein